MPTSAEDEVSVMEKGAFFAGVDRYLFYDFEDVLFAWDSRSRQIRMKFVGDANDAVVPDDQRLFNDAILNGREISRAEYDAGRVLDPSTGG